MPSRASRLLQLLERLHDRRQPVPAARLAESLGVSLRTIYRDVATLREQGADIVGDPGVGYQMRPGFLLPPLMFTPDELEALLLGAHWVKGLADPELARAADSALNRITATLPASLRLAVQTSGLFVPKPAGTPAAEPWLPTLRAAIRDEVKLDMRYVDAGGEMTRRTVWPFAMAFFGSTTRLFAAWCELRDDIRHFRAERVNWVAATGQRYPVRRHELIRRWRATEPDHRPAAPRVG